MPQLLLPGMPEGAIRINPVVSRLSKDGRMTWFVGADNYFSHLADDSAGHRLANIKDSTLRKAIAAGRLIKPATPHPTAAPTAAEPSSKSQRSRTDARAAEAIGTACTRADERTAAAFGLAESATTRFESATDLALGGVLCGLPALCANGLFTGLDRHLSLPKGYYPG